MTVKFDPDFQSFVAVWYHCEFDLIFKSNFVGLYNLIIQNVSWAHFWIWTMGSLEIRQLQFISVMGLGITLSLILEKLDLQNWYGNSFNLTMPRSNLSWQSNQIEILSNWSGNPINFEILADLIWQSKQFGIKGKIDMVIQSIWQHFRPIWANQIGFTGKIDLVSQSI